MIKALIKNLIKNLGICPGKLLFDNEKSETLSKTALVLPRGFVDMETVCKRGKTHRCIMPLFQNEAWLSLDMKLPLLNRKRFL